MTSWNGNIFPTTGPLWGEFTSHRWTYITMASDADLGCFLWSAPWINGWVNTREASDLKLHRAHYDVIVMYSPSHNAFVISRGQVFLIIDTLQLNFFDIMYTIIISLSYTGRYINTFIYIVNLMLIHASRCCIYIVIIRRCRLGIMTSWNGGIFRVTGTLCWKFSSHRWITLRKGQWHGALMFLLICGWINGLSEQSRRRWFETPARSLWRHCNGWW